MKRKHIFVIIAFTILLLTATIFNNQVPKEWTTNGKVKYSNNTFTIESKDITYIYQEIEGDKTITAK